MVDPRDRDMSWALRRGGEVRVLEDALVVDRGAGEPVRVELDDVVEVTQRSVDWFTGILSVVLVGIGVYLTREHVLGGLLFAGAGAASVYVTYRRRNETNLRVRGRAKPLKLYPADGQRFYTDLGRLLEVEDARSDEPGADAGDPDNA